MEKRLNAGSRKCSEAGRDEEEEEKSWKLPRVQKK
jgi:hypothetical protein